MSGGGETFEGASGPGAGTPHGSPQGNRPQADSRQLLEATRRLRDAARRHAHVLALAAADLRGPVASLVRQVKRLKRGAAEVGEERTLEVLDRQVRRLAEVSASLLALRALDAGQGQLERRPTDLRDVLLRLAADHRGEALEREVDLSASVPDTPVTLPADPERLAAAVRGLLVRALATCSRGGRVDVVLTATQDGARICVEESLEGSRERRGEGRVTSGVSLELSRIVAEMHGGALELVLRDGCRAAVLTLPGAPAEAELPPAVGGRSARILVVDDDQDARDALSMMLGDDYEILLAADGREAVDVALATGPDVVLMDLYMPVMDGLAALDAMRSDPLTQDLPVILISARGDDLTRSRSLDLGAVDFLQKPFSGRELKSRIERTLRLTRRETQLQALARTDPLTGLANLRAFRVRLDDEVKRARRYRTPLACIMVDMDHLKPINDELGHGAGNLAIGAVADVIRRELRETDFGARYGGDEFVMLLPHTTAEEARVLAERVCVRIHEASIDAGGRKVTLSASFGIAALAGHEALGEHDGESLLHRADAALYAAKRAGRGRVVPEAPDPDAAAHA